jgi:hypothetical protein
VTDIFTPQQRSEIMSRIHSRDTKPELATADRRIPLAKSAAAPYAASVDRIRYFNRDTGSVETEQVYGEAFLRWTYGNPLGKLALAAFVKRPFF